MLHFQGLVIVEEDADLEAGKTQGNYFQKFGFIAESFTVGGGTRLVLTTKQVELIGRAPPPDDQDVLLLISSVRPDLSVLSRSVSMAFCNVFFFFFPVD